MSVQYPFSALVAQDALKTALLILAVSPSVGGVLVRGEKGTAKSTAARGLAEILPPVQKVRGCPFNCSFFEPLDICDVCRQPGAAVEPMAVPFVTLPLGATEDRVVGSLDFERALKDKARAFQPGLLAAAHRGILYIDEVNLLSDHLVDVLLDAAAMGVNAVQREGLSVSHPARFALIGTMNLEEGDLRPQLLDRFGLMVEVEAPREPSQRVEIVRRRRDFEAGRAEFALLWSESQEDLRQQVVFARSLLPAVEIDEALLLFISQLCCRLEIRSLRADIVMERAGKALAALHGRARVNADDIYRVAQLVLPHRRRRRPFDESALAKEMLEEMMQDVPASPPPLSPPLPEGDAPSISPGDPPGQAAPVEGGESNGGSKSKDERAASCGQEEVFAASAFGAVRHLAIESDGEFVGPGRRSISNSAGRGQYVRALAAENPSSLAVDATLRHAVLRCPDNFQVKREDFHEKILRGKTGNLILFVVDASGSMAALKRMETVKGCVLALLTDAYEQRDTVAVISFRASGAQVLLPATRNVDVAQERLRELPTGGRTPLAAALVLARETLVSASAGGKLEPLLVLVSDGRANVSLSEGSDPWQDTLTAAARLKDLGHAALVVDSETGALPLGMARELAAALGAEYLELAGLSADDLALTIARRGRGRSR